MYRCALPAAPPPAMSSSAHARRHLLIAFGVAAQLAVAGAIGTALLGVSEASAQIAPGHRFFPMQALRGTLIVGAAPDVSLNGKSARLAPGARIRDANDMLAMPGQLVGQKLMVHYTRDINGLLMDVWVLNAVEQANKPWPTTEREGASWSFSPATQRWIKS